MRTAKNNNNKPDDERQDDYGADHHKFLLSKTANIKEMITTTKVAAEQAHKETINIHQDKVMMFTTFIAANVNAKRPIA